MMTHLLAILLTAQAAIAAAPPEPAAPSAPPRQVCPKDPKAAEKAARHTYSQLVAEYADALPGPRGESHRERRVEEIIARSLDVGTFARETLKRVWTKGDAAQQRRWTETLGSMLHRKYRDRLQDPHKHRLTITKVKLVKCHFAVVEGRLVPRIRKRTDDGNDVVLRMSHGPSGWRVYDVKVDETSLLLMWRSRFRRIYNDGKLAAVEGQLAKLAKRYPCKTPACKRFAKP